MQGQARPPGSAGSATEQYKYAAATTAKVAATGAKALPIIGNIVSVGSTLLAGGGGSPVLDRAAVYVIQLPSLGAVANPFTSATFRFNLASISGTTPNMDWSNGLSAEVARNPITAVKRALIEGRGAVCYRLSSAWDTARPAAQSQALAQALGGIVENLVCRDVSMLNPGEPNSQVFAASIQVSVLARR